VKIIEIDPNSLAEKHGFSVGDKITHVNGNPIRDEIDWRFYSSDDFLDIKFQREGINLLIEIEKNPEDLLGITFEEIRYRSCGNKCIFCFVDQNPQNLRSSLYLKDEDFRLSFIYGNYVTLTNLSPRDAKRIVTQRLSPLYVSVHAVDLSVRQKLLGIRHDDHLLSKIQYLTRHGIEIHVQIVLCPGYNDGEILNDTLSKLSRFYPELRSIAIVPLGLTKHRERLPPLTSVTLPIAAEVINWGEEQARQYYKRWQSYFIYLADEFYLQAGAPFPAEQRYDDFPQIENGVGMTRNFIDLFESTATEFPSKLENPRSITLVTGKLAEPIIRSLVLERLNTIQKLTVNLVPVSNHFFGSSVTVSGLLTGQDIYHALSDTITGDEIFLPENCLNYNNLFLDDWTIENLEHRLRKRVKVIHTNFIELFEKKTA
jgi:putative radical SAM enzyme (TIGR03279 family)